jgi:CheY-like chemotaxis protein
MQRLVERTLLIDDSDIDLFIQRRFLEVYHFSTELQLFKSAEEALTWLKGIEETNVPNIIFLDLNMPECDGFAFLRAFNDLPGHIQTKAKIVVLTSSNSSKDREQAFTFKNVIQFITKPLKQTDIEDLRKLIDN